MLSIGFVVFALGAPQQSLMLRDMDFRRVEVLPMIGRARGRGGRRGGGRGRRRRLGDHRPVRGGRDRDDHRRLAALPVEAPASRSRVDSLRELGGFSIFMLGHRMLYYLQTNGDRFLIGRFLGTAALGTYAIAFNTILQPASKIGGPLQRVMSPGLLPHPGRARADRGRLGAGGRGSSPASRCPPLAGLVVVAPDFVPVVLGDQWDAAIPVIQILAWVGIVQALQSLSVDVLMARDRARTIFRFSLVLVTCHLAAFAVGLNWGVVGVAVAFAVSTTLVEPWQTILAARALGVSPLVFLRSHLRRLPGSRRHVPGHARRARWR